MDSSAQPYTLFSALDDEDIKRSFKQCPSEICHQILGIRHATYEPQTEVGAGYEDLIIHFSCCGTRSVFAVAQVVLRCAGCAGTLGNVGSDAVGMVFAALRAHVMLPERVASQTLE